MVSVENRTRCLMVSFLPVWLAACGPASSVPNYSEHLQQQWVGKSYTQFLTQTGYQPRDSRILSDDRVLYYFAETKNWTNTSHQYCPPSSNTSASNGGVAVTVNQTSCQSRVSEPRSGNCN
jgi:hypothetical protein